jgi:hypothetical protein
MILSFVGGIDFALSLVRVSFFLSLLVIIEHNWDQLGVTRDSENT